MAYLRYHLEMKTDKVALFVNEKLEYFVLKYNPKHFRNELEIMEEVKSVQNIPRIVEIFPEEYRFLMTGLNAPDLRQVLLDDNNLPFREIEFLFRTLLQTLTDIHNLGIAHRDIKLENIVYCRKTSQILLIDFEYSRQSPSDNLGGTKRYLWPKFVAGKMHSIVEMQLGDVFALGIVFYLLINIDFPYKIKQIKHWQVYDLSKRYKSKDLTGPNGDQQSSTSHCVLEQLVEQYQRKYSISEIFTRFEKFILFQTSGI